MVLARFDVAVDVLGASDGAGKVPLLGASPQPPAARGARISNVVWKSGTYEARLVKNFHQSAPPFEAAKLIKKERPSNRAFIGDASPRHREPCTGRAPLGPRRGAIENFFP